MICFPHEETKISLVIVLDLEIFNQLSLFSHNGMTLNYLCTLCECLFSWVWWYTHTETRRPKGKKTGCLNVWMKKLYFWFYCWRCRVTSTAVLTGHHGQHYHGYWRLPLSISPSLRNILCHRCQITHVERGIGGALCVISHTTWQLYFDTSKKKKKITVIDSHRCLEEKERDLHRKKTPNTIKLHCVGVHEIFTE